MAGLAAPLQAMGLAGRRAIPVLELLSCALSGLSCSDGSVLAPPALCASFLTNLSGRLRAFGTPTVDVGWISMGFQAATPDLYSIGHKPSLLDTVLASTLQKGAAAQYLANDSLREFVCFGKFLTTGAPSMEYLSRTALGLVHLVKPVNSGMSFANINILCLGTAAGCLYFVKKPSKQEQSTGPYGVGPTDNIPDGDGPIKEILKLLKKAATFLREWYLVILTFATCWRMDITVYQGYQIVDTMISEVCIEMKDKIESYLRTANRKEEGNLAEVTVAYASFDHRTKQVYQVVMLSSEADEASLRGLMKDIQKRQPSLPGPIHPGLLALLRGHEEASVLQFLGSLTKQDEMPTPSTTRPKSKLSVPSKRVKDSADAKIQKPAPSKPRPSIPWRIGT